MKRIELFEFEDHPRFPSWLRDLMTAYLRAFHRIFRTAPAVVDLVRQALAASQTKRIRRPVQRWWRTDAGRRS